MTKPLVEGRFEYVIVFKEETSPKEAQNNERAYLFTLKRLTESGLIVHHEFTANRHILTVTTSAFTFETEAEREEFLKLRKDIDSITKKPRLEIFLLEDGPSFKGYGTPDFFKPSERCSIVHNLIEQVHAGEIADNITINSPVDPKEFLVDILLKHGLVEVFCPLHESERRRKLKQQVFLLKQLVPDVNDIESYFGSKVAFYFGWLHHFTLWLIVPGVASATMYIMRRADYNVDVDVYVSYFSIGMIIWGFFFLESWKQKANAYACVWGSLDVEDKEISIRHNYHGSSRISPVTGRTEYFYPQWRRWLIHYPCSILVTVGMLGVALCVMCCSLNLQGYINGPGEIDENGQPMLHSPIHVPFLAKFAKNGAIFDPNNSFWYPSLLPVVCHCVVIMILNKVYRNIAEWLTELENHKTHIDHERSLVYKRFIFEAFDCYLALFYIAFYEHNIFKLRGELVALFTADSARRVFVESILPLILQKLSSKVNSKPTSSASKDKKIKNDEVDSQIILDEIQLEEYESFDDYLEMIIELGYVLLFASAFPLAAPLSIFCNIIEYRSDVFKLTTNVRRPHAEEAKNIDPWVEILTVIVWASVFTNVIVMGVTSEQLKTLFPSRFTDLGNTHMANKEGVVLMVGIEHVLLLAGLLINIFVPDFPAWVRDDIDRRNHEKRLALIDQRKEQLLKNAPLAIADRSEQAVPQAVSKNAGKSAPSSRPGKNPVAAFRKK